MVTLKTQTPTKNSKNLTKNQKVMQKIREYTGFYARQSFKSLMIMVAFYLPLDMLNNFIQGIPYNAKEMGASNYFIATAKLSYYSTIASLIFVLGIVIVLFKIEWSKQKFETKKMEKAIAKETLLQYKKQLEEKKAQK